MGLPVVSLPSFLGPGSATAQASLGLPTVSMAVNNLPSSPYIFRSSSNQSEARQQVLGVAAEFEQPFAARLRSNEGKTRLEEGEQDEDRLHCMVSLLVVVVVSTTPSILFRSGLSSSSEVEV